MFGFFLSRAIYFNVSRRFATDSSPGEWYWYSNGLYRVGITMHLATVIPAGFLCIWQFVPIIRHKALLFHRINGYIVIYLLFVGTAGALMIARRAFGALVATIGGVYVLAFIVIVEMCLAYYNIKRLQVDQHRAWMLRAWITSGSIITLRIILNCTARIISHLGDYYLNMPCEEIQAF
jgi:uncharacterized membrane protein